MEQYIKQLRETDLSRLNDRDRLIVSNYKLAVSAIREYRGRGLEEADLLGSALEGLIHAADHFRPSQGTDFAPYASRWVHGAICRALSTDGHLIHVPEQLRNDMEHDEALAEWLGSLLAPAEDLQRVLCEEDGVPLVLGDTIADADACRAAELREEVEEQLVGYTPQQREILVRHYLRGEELRDIARSMHLSDARVRQIHRLLCPLE